MLKRMAIWAQNFEVAGVVVFAISVFVMHTKNFWVFVIPASLARLNQVAPSHRFSHRSKCWLPQFFCGFIDALFGTVLTFVRRGIQKLHFAMGAGVLNSAFLRHCFVVARRRTVLSLVSPTGDVRKVCGADCAC
jgi:hypothetical protein